MEAGLTETHLWLKGGSRHQSRRRDKLRNFDWLGSGGGGLHLRQDHTHVDPGKTFCCANTGLLAAVTHVLLLLSHTCGCLLPKL